MKTIFILFLMLTGMGAYSQWSSDPSVNNAVCNFAGNQMNVQVTSDGAGGAICTWVDTRNGSQDIYAQRIDANGTLQWNVDGIAICNAVSDQYYPRLVPDAAGGAIIAWYDNRAGNYDIYAQRIDASGVVLWAADGVAITTQPGNQNAHQLIADGSGGAIIAWSDAAGGGSNADIRAQLINASGTILWPVGGASVCNASSLQNIPNLVSDGTGGAIISWEDWRSYSQADIYAQRISSNGFTNWSFNGIPVCTEPNLAHQYSTKIISDGAGGAIICWQDNRTSSTGLNIYTQKVNATGTVQWTWDGVAVCTATGLQGFQQLVSDGAGGAIYTWEDRRSGQADIYAQRLNTSGAAQWAANGIAVCNAGAVQNEAQIVPRASGGATIIWTDLRNSSQEDIYAQAVTLAGAVLWTANGVPVANESHAQFASHLIADGGDGAIIAWQDSRSTLNYDIYSSKLFSDGTLPVKLTSFTAALQHKNTFLQWQIANELNVAKYNIQRSLDGNSFTTIGAVHSTGNSTATKNYSYTDNTISNLNAGRIFYRLQIVDIDGKLTYSKMEVVKPAADMPVSIAPNPVHDHIIVSSQYKLNMLSIINIMGQVLRTVSLTGSANPQTIDVRELPAGNYFIKAVGEEQVWTKHFIKQ